MPREYRFFVYIMASKSRRIYTGATNNIDRRVAQHKAGEIKGFTQRYKINRLVYYQEFRLIGNAIRREKEIKGWDRAKRVALIAKIPHGTTGPRTGKRPSLLSSLSLFRRKQIPRSPRRPHDDKPKTRRLLS